MICRKQRECNVWQKQTINKSKEILEKRIYRNEMKYADDYDDHRRKRNNQNAPDIIQLKNVTSTEIYTQESQIKKTIEKKSNEKWYNNVDKQNQAFNSIVSIDYYNCTNYHKICYF